MFNRFSDSVAITGFCALHDVRGKFHSYNSANAPSLEALFAHPLHQPRDDFPLDQFWNLLTDELSALQIAVPSGRIGTVFSSSKGRMALSAEACPPVSWTCDWALGKVCALSGGTGPSLAPVAACAGGAHAIALGAQMIINDQADVVLAGAIEAPLPALAMAAYRQMNALSRSGIMRPFDVRRDGFWPRPGAACLILENAQLARERGAPLLTLLSSWAFLSDVHSLLAMSPDGDSIERLIRHVLHKSTFEEIPDYINLHATATPQGDLVEARGVAAALGTSVPCSATKPLTGHTLGAAGAIEALLTIAALRQNMIPPTLNLEQKDAACPIEVVTGEGLRQPLHSALSLSYGFGGHMGALYFRKCEEKRA